MFPSINKIFPGKPVQTKYGEGYVLGEKFSSAESETIFFVNIKGVTHEIVGNDILPDMDQNEIFNDMSMLKVPDVADEEPVKVKTGFWSNLFSSKNKT